MIVLVAGWFSFTGMNVTAGDVLARDVACDWLDELGVAYDVASVGPCGPGRDWHDVAAGEYGVVVFVCGPFRDNTITREFLAHFDGARMIGLDLSMIQPTGEWNPFDVLLERDSDRGERPDLAFASKGRLVPLVGCLLVHPQKQYGDRAMHESAHHAVRTLVASREIAVVNIDTRLEDNLGGLRTVAEVETMVARMDVVITTRLHGLVLALKHGVPVLAVDPIAGGAKISAQCRAVGWPVLHDTGRLGHSGLSTSLEYSLSQEARAVAIACRSRAEELLSGVPDSSSNLRFERRPSTRLEPGPSAISAMADSQGCVWLG